MKQEDNLTALKNELLQVELKLKALRKNNESEHTSRVAQSFHLGMVGGSGRNNASLNKRRAKELDKTIDNAIISTDLYEKQRDLIKRIDYIESGKKEAFEAKQKREQELLVQYWRELKAGDELNIGNSNGNPIISKKSAKSVTTQGGAKWTAAEIIGKKAASLL